MIVIILPDKIFQHILFTFPFQISTIVRICFKSRNLSSNMTKSTIFSMKHRKNQPAMVAPRPSH